MHLTTVVFFILGLASLIIAGPVQLIAEEDRKYGLAGVQLTPIMVAQLKEMSANLTGSTGPNNNTLKERNKSDILCADRIGAYGWPWAVTTDIWQAIWNILQASNTCFIGHNQCAAIGCVKGSCIVLCNDNGYDIAPDCKYLSSYASEIIDRCDLQLHWGGQHIIGQRFDTDHYNIIVRGF